MGLHPSAMTLPPPPAGASAVPDSRGINLYRADPALRRLAGLYLPALVSQDLDALHQGGMFMTEQGAGSDVGGTAVGAEPAPDGESWRLFGDKWFCSNADADLAMVL